MQFLVFLLCFSEILPHSQKPHQQLISGFCLLTNNRKFSLLSMKMYSGFIHRFFYTSLIFYTIFNFFEFRSFFSRFSAVFLHQKNESDFNLPVQYSKFLLFSWMFIGNSCNDFLTLKDFLKNFCFTSFCQTCAILSRLVSLIIRKDDISECVCGEGGESIKYFLKEVILA